MTTGRQAQPFVRMSVDRIDGRGLRGHGDRIALHDLAHRQRTVTLFGVVGADQVEELALRHQTDQPVVGVLDHDVADVVPDHQLGHQIDRLVLVRR